jgi:hypothetical protein
VDEHLGVDPAQRRESWLNERAAGRARIAQGVAIAAAIPVVAALMVLVDSAALFFVATCYVCYALVDGPRRILGGLATYLGAISSLRAIERAGGAAPTSARLLP